MEFEMVFTTHGVRVHRASDNIRVWKFNNVKTDFQVFDTEDEATDYIVKPFPSLEWRVEVQDSID
jgi:uncharacterized protein (DUF2384 family)